MSYFKPAMATLVIFCFIASPAAASGKSGFAISAGLGISQIKDRDGTESFNANAFGFTVGGEYRFNDYFGLGINLFDLGTADDEFNSVNTEIDVDGFDIVFRLIMPVSESVEVFGIIGQATYYADLDPGGSNFLGDDAFELGLGLDIGSAENFAFRLAGRYYDGPRDESGALVTAGFNYRF